MGVNHLLKLRGLVRGNAKFPRLSRMVLNKGKVLWSTRQDNESVRSVPDQTLHFTWAESYSSSGWTNLSIFRLAKLIQMPLFINILYSQNEFKRKKKPFCKIWLKIMHLYSSATESMLVNSQQSSNVFSQLITCMFSFTVQPQQSWNNMVR